MLLAAGCQVMGQPQGGNERASASPEQESHTCRDAAAAPALSVTPLREDIAVSIAPEVAWLSESSAPDAACCSPAAASDAEAPSPDAASDAASSAAFACAPGPAPGIQEICVRVAMIIML